MKLYLDLDTRAFYPAPSPVASIKRIQFKRRDTEFIQIIFAQKSKPIELPTGYVGTLGIKKFNQFNSNYIAVAPNWQVVSVDGVTAYGFYLNFFTSEIETAFSTIALGGALQAMLEVQWKNIALPNPVINSSVTLAVSINNDVIRGDEGVPSPATNDFRATQIESEAGVDNTKWMTPLRTAQAIAALGGAFYSATPPPNPSEGQIWTDSNDFTSYQYLEGNWIET